jgi:hypothetical protein
MTGAHVPYWALTETWADGDPRWEQVQTGRIPRSAAYGIAHMFPLTVTTEDMAAYVEQRYGDQHRVTGGEAAKEASRMVDDAQQSQRTTQTTNIERATQTSLERHERESKHALRVRAGVERAHPMIEVP